MGNDDKQPNESVVLMEYLPKLIRLAERNMSARLKQKLGSDDMADSILGSVIRMSRAGKLRIEESDEFWRILVAISLNKVRKKARFYQAQKRDAGRELTLGDDWHSLEELAKDHGEPSVEDGEVVGELLGNLMERLDSDCKAVLSGKLENKSNHEIAATLGTNGKSTKTVTRCWNKIQEEMKAMIGPGGA